MERRLVAIIQATKEKYMLFSNIFKMSVIVVIFCCVTACVKYHDLSLTEFPQGKKQPDRRIVAQTYRRQAKIYDEFETVAAFDVLWLSDSMRKTYVDVFGSRRGLAAEAQEEMLKRQLEENRHWLSFYLLADIRDKTYVSLSDPSAAWTVYSIVDGVKLIPAEKKEGIKEVDLEPEYQLFLGPTFDLFKAAYLIRIPISSELAVKLEKGEFNSIKLFVTSTHKECSMEWTKKQLAKKVKKVTCDEDFYWG